MFIPNENVALKVIETLGVKYVGLWNFTMKEQFPPLPVLTVTFLETVKLIKSWANSSI